LFKEGLFRRNELPAGSGSKSRSKKAEKAEVKKAEKTIAVGNNP
jgi:hypothetical protein